MKTLAAIPCHNEGLMNRIGRIESAEVCGLRAGGETAAPSVMSNG